VRSEIPPQRKALMNGRVHMDDIEKMKSSGRGMMVLCKSEQGRYLVKCFNIVLIAGAMVLSGCMLTHPQGNDALAVQNNVRFVHAYNDARADLSHNEFSKAEAIAEAWKKYPYLTSGNQHLLLDLDHQIGREMAIYRMGEARQLERVGHLNGALSKVSQAARLDPSWTIPKRARRHLLILIEVQNQMGRQWEALSSRLLLLRKEEPANPELDRTLAWSYRHLAQSRFDSNHPAGAYRSVKKALLLDPADTDSMELKNQIIKEVNLQTLNGEAYFRKNRIRKAIMSFRNALLIRPSDPRARRDLDMALEAQALGRGPRHHSVTDHPPAPRI